MARQIQKSGCIYLSRRVYLVKYSSWVSDCVQILLVEFSVIQDPDVLEWCAMCESCGGHRRRLHIVSWCINDEKNNETFCFIFQDFFHSNWSSGVTSGAKRSDSPGMSCRINTNTLTWHVNSNVYAVLLQIVLIYSPGGVERDVKLTLVITVIPN